jgi:hypothetical protein
VSDNPSPTLYFSPLVCSEVAATLPIVNLTWQSVGSVCTGAPASNYVKLTWTWDFINPGPNLAVDGFYIYADGYRVGAITALAYQANSGCTGANSLGSTTACYNLAPGGDELLPYHGSF